ncbi:MAG: ABC transporter permease [Pseudomonadota bacterium]
MFISSRKPQSGIASAFAMCEVIYHSIVRSVRSSHNNAFMAIGMNMMQAVIFVAAFYVMFSVLGLRGAAIRGDFLLYIMSGIFLFLTHTKSLSAVLGAEGPASAMMQHAPMNTIVSILSAALGALYVQVLSLFMILFIYHVGFTPIEIDQAFPAFGMLVLAWFTGCSIGLVLMALKPWFPTFVSIFSTIYQRANMIASGKMFVANTLPGYMLAMFDWNPLFHCIDQARGYVFINYNPHHSSWEYAFWLGVVFVMIGLMGEFYTRRHASLSWSARR